MWVTRKKNNAMHYGVWDVPSDFKVRKQKNVKISNAKCFFCIEIKSSISLILIIYSKLPEDLSLPFNTNVR